MISLDIKSEAKTASASPLSLSTPTDEPTLSFSELLRGISDKKDEKIIQNGSLILSLGTEEKELKDTKASSKADALLSLLKGEDTLVLKQKPEPVEFNPIITANLTTKDLKTLIADAKTYLKDKILENPNFKMSEVKELPKTLKGLVEVAKKLNIDISKITIEEVKIHVETKNIKKDDIKTLITKEAIDKAPQGKDVSQDHKIKDSHVKELLQNKEVKVQLSKEIEVQNKEVKVQVSKEIEVQNREVKAQDKEVQVQVSKEIEVQNKEVKVQVKITKEVNLEDKREVKAEVQVTKDVNVQDKEVKVQDKAQTKEQKIEPLSVKAVIQDKKEVKESTSKNETIDEKSIHVKQEVKTTPLFKAQTVVEHTTTEQIVQVKQHRVDPKTAKNRADETLKLLLRGEKPSMENPALTADFSVATAKVIASTATTDTAKSLEKLLHGDSTPAEDGVDVIKAETRTTQVDDGFEAKLKEAKQMIKYLSADVKTAIEDYKSPFTRVKVQLNPAKLGEIDVTVVQRGKNLHVNLSSNNAAINTLVMNANELKVQLSNSGINNATLNFNNSSQNGENAQQQQQNHQKQKEAHEEYGILRKLDNEEANEEILNSLEIIVPQYG